MKKLMTAMVLCLVCTLFCSCNKGCLCTSTDKATGVTSPADSIVSHSITQDDEFCKAISYENDNVIFQCE